MRLSLPSLPLFLPPNGSFSRISYFSESENDAFNCATLVEMDARAVMLRDTVHWFFLSVCELRHLLVQPQHVLQQVRGQKNQDTAR